MSAEAMPTTVDSQGKRCPAPVLDLAEAVEELADGDEVLLLADDPTARIDVPVWCRMKHHELMEVTEDDGVLAFRVRRRG